MKTPTLISMICLGLAPGVKAGQDHILPNITGYERPYISYQLMGYAQTQLLKERQLDGSKEPAGISVQRVVGGVMRERYDNKFSYIQGFYADSVASESGPVSRRRASLNQQFGIAYGSGVHLSDNVDWSLFLEASTGQLEVDYSRRYDVGIGIGTQVTVGLGRYIDVGGMLLFSRHYSGVGATVSINLY